MTINVYVFETVTNDSCSQFNITVIDDQGNYIPDANVYLYSFFDGDIVASDLTNSAGQCNFSYTPEFDGSKRETLYCDFLIYVQKPGYVSAEWDVTKFYGMDDTNDTEFLIQLESDNHVAIQSKNSVLPKAVQQYIKTQPEKPFYVISGEDFSEIASSNGVSPLELLDIPINPSLFNAAIPIGEFHVCKGASLKVIFTQDDSIELQSGLVVSNSTGTSTTFSISGSTKRKFESVTAFDTFTTNKNVGQKQIFRVWGTIKTYYTVDGPNARWTQHIVLDHIQGGDDCGQPQNCTTCCAPYEDVKGNKYGSYSHVPNESGLQIGSSTTITLDFNQKLSLDLIEGLNVSGSLGVKIGRTANTTLLYKRTGNYDVGLYDIDFTGKTLHVTTSLY